MNIALRKLAMLEKVMNERAEAERMEGYTSCPIDSEFRQKVTALMDKVRTI